MFEYRKRIGQTKDSVGIAAGRNVTANAGEQGDNADGTKMKGRQARLLTKSMSFAYMKACHDQLELLPVEWCFM